MAGVGVSSAAEVASDQLSGLARRFSYTTTARRLDPGFRLSCALSRRHLRLPERRPPPSRLDQELEAGDRSVDLKVRTAVDPGYGGCAV